MGISQSAVFFSLAVELEFLKGSEKLEAKSSGDSVLYFGKFPEDFED